jgi:hypothetical protein
MASGLLANRKRKGYGKLSTHCRTGRGPNTSSTRCRALSAMRRAPQLGQKPALLAGIRHQPLGTAVLADHAQEAVLEHAAAQVGLELLAHILGQRAVFYLTAREKVRPMRLHQRIQQRALGTVRRIASRGQMRCRRRCVRHGILQLRHGRGEARHETLRCREWLLKLAPAPAGSYRPFPVFVSDIAALKTGRFPRRTPESTKPGKRPGFVVTLACWRARFARRADAFAPPLARWADLEVHTAHATHAATTVVVGRGFLLRQLGDHGFGGDHQAGDRGGVLQGRTGHLGRVEDTHGDHVAEFAGGGVGTVRQSADSAQQASRLSAETQVIADRGRVAVDEVGSTMRVIQESSQRISEITQVIDSIAFQTNILALNAAVEAARAGEQGRGFAVVAAEVRALAQRSAGAAKEIKQLIDDSVSKVETGHEKTEVARKTMGEVVDSVRRVNALVDEISHAAREICVASGTR